MSEREEIAERIEQMIRDYEPICSPQYIRGMRAALLVVTGEIDAPLFERVQR